MQDGRTALHWAAAGGHLDLVEYLVSLTPLFSSSPDAGLAEY